MYIVPPHDSNGSSFWLWWHPGDMRSPHLRSAFVLRCDLSDLHTYPQRSLEIIVRAVGCSIDYSIEDIKKNIQFAEG
jgi:hypothetical protein